VPGAVAFTLRDGLPESSAACREKGWHARRGFEKKDRRASLPSLGIKRGLALPGNGAIDVATSQLSHVVRHLRRAAQAQEGGELRDGQLLECFVTRRDEAAFEALVRRHGPMVLGVCRRLLRHPQDAEDAFQVTFLVLARKAKALRQGDLVGNWLYGTACRAAQEVKAARRRVQERQVSPMPEPVTVEEADVWRDLRPILDQELNRLPDRYRVAVVLCDLEGGTRREVAARARHTGRNAVGPPDHGPADAGQAAGAPGRDPVGRGVGGVRVRRRGRPRRLFPR
jgi:RNA polymerase sigma factor (sigma-70 family)